MNCLHSISDDLMFNQLLTPLFIVIMNRRRCYNFSNKDSNEIFCFPALADTKMIEDQQIDQICSLDIKIRGLKCIKQYQTKKISLFFKDSSNNLIVFRYLIFKGNIFLNQADHSTCIMVNMYYGYSTLFKTAFPLIHSLSCC